MHFEVFVTHDLSKEKIQFFEDNKIKCVRIDLSNPDLLTASQETIKNKVLNQYHNKILIYWENNIVTNNSVSNNSVSNNAVSNNGSSNNWIGVIIAAIILFFTLKWLSKKKYW